jgi:uncharacterized membrane protein
LSLIEILKQSAWGEALITFLVSMVPVIELRGAIPIGVGMGLSPWTAMLVSVIGNMVPVPLIILFIRRIFAWLRRHFPKLDGLVARLENKAHLKGETVKKYKYLGLCIFVAIPLPGTGAWTGALIAAFLDMRLKRAVPTIFLGVLIAGFLITGITFGFTVIF